MIIDTFTYNFNLPKLSPAAITEDSTVSKSKLRSTDVILVSSLMIGHIPLTENPSTQVWVSQITSFRREAAGMLIPTK